MTTQPSDLTSNAAGGTGEIVCHTTPWYFRRMGLMFLMVTAFGLWFLKDGLWKYPDEIAIYAEYQVFEERSKAYDQFEAEGRLQDWPAFAAEKGWDEGEPQDWRDYAASRDKPLPEEPEERLPGKEREQLFWAAGMGALALAILVVFLINRPKSLKADATSFTTPDGRRIAFDSVHRVDKRKWKNKGLAYAHYKSDKGAGKATIDDLKFGGADAVLDRLLANFEGELIDRVEPPEDEEENGDSDAEPVGENGEKT